jgi:hypothetical protein
LILSPCFEGSRYFISIREKGTGLGCKARYFYLVYGIGSRGAVKEGNIDIESLIKYLKGRGNVGLEVFNDKGILLIKKKIFFVILILY